MSDEEERTRYLAKAVMDVAAAAMADDGDGIANRVDEAGERYGNRGVFTVCCGLAELVVQANKMREHGAAVAAEAGLGPEGWWGVEFQGEAGRIEPGDTLGLGLEGEDLIHEKAVIFVGRFLTACLNRDLAIATSLFWSPIEAKDEQQLVTNVWHLCGMAGAMLRSAERLDYEEVMDKLRRTVE